MSREEDLFAEARVLPAAERHAYLAQHCADDPTLRVQVEGLLAGFAEMERAGPTPFAANLAAPPEEKTGDRLGRYRLVEKIGEGGCGVVWLAEQEEPVRREVALKVIKLGMDTREVIARFEAERQALAVMNHPNIAKVFDAGATDAGRPFFVMELVRGVAITRYCDDAKLSTEARLNLFIEVCHAIRHAHQKGIIHRDLKPSNILVADELRASVQPSSDAEAAPRRELEPEARTRPKIIDFGIAKATQGRLTDATMLTAFAQFIGTPAYMSPEQAEFSGLEIDPRSDVYSLGVLLYELLTGRPPFDPKTLQQAGLDEIRRIIREVEPPRPSTRLNTLTPADRTALAKFRDSAPAQLSTRLSGDLDGIVMHCLEKDRSRRYQSVDDLALDLQRHLRHEPVLARPPGLAYRVGKLIRRHRLGFATAAIVTLAVAFGATISLQQSLRADRAERAVTALKAPPPALNPKSIAVLPFENLSENREASAFFVEGVHEDVIASLTRIRELRCVPRTTALSYRGTKKTNREIGAELAVAFLLHCTVRRAENRVRIVATLIDARTDAARWTKAYDRDLTDIFFLQSEIAQAIAAELKAVISPETQKTLERFSTVNPSAYDSYLRAREIRSRNLYEFMPRADAPFREHKYLEAQEMLLQSAVAIEPRFALAWADLAWIHGSTYYGFQTTYRDRTDARRAKAKAAIDTAVALSPNAPEVILALGYYYQFCERDNRRASGEFERAAQLLPNSPSVIQALAQLRRAQGQWSEAVSHYRKTVALDPGNDMARVELAILLNAGRRYNEAMMESRRLLHARPESDKYRGDVGRLPFYATGSTREMDAAIASPGGQFWSFRFATQHEKYIDSFDYSSAPPRPDATTKQSWYWEIHFAVILAARGDVAAARHRLEHAPANLRARLEVEPTNTTLLCDLACIEAILGHAEEALRHAQKAVSLTPMADDQWQAPQMEENLAFVYAWTGDKERAIATYARLLQTPYISPRLAKMSVHVMRHALWFAPLRGDPRWEALLNDPKNNAPLF
jgi:serine/threonine protein kinase/Flp pilus assembly protein TadD